MAEQRVPTTTKVGELITAHSNELEKHGISGGLAANRPAAGTAGRYYFATNTKTWSRDNGTSWDENIRGLSDTEVQSLIDTSISTHTTNANAHHTAPTYDSQTDEIVFQI